MPAPSFRRLLRALGIPLVCALALLLPRLAAAGSGKCEHTVAKGETLSGIAARKGVSVPALIKANPALKKNPNRLRTGQKLDICKAKREQSVRPPSCEDGGKLVTHTVGKGETLGAIAARYSVSQASMRRHNKRLAKRARSMIRVGEKLRVCTQLRRYTNRSWFKEGVQLPEGEGYHVRRPGNAWGTDSTVAAIVAAVARYGERQPDAPVVQIGDISRENGGPLREHVSHQEGRDVDVGYIFDTPAGDEGGKTLDLGKTWTLLRAFADDDSVAVIFIDYRLQKRLYEYAQSIGEDQATLDRLMEYPRGSDEEAVFYHWPGHTRHFHVRYGKVPPDSDTDEGDDEAEAPGDAPENAFSAASS